MDLLALVRLSTARHVVATLLSPRARATDDHPAGELHTVTFGLDGQSYEIDLPADEAAALRADLAPWVAHARPRSDRTPTIRDWARANGHPVSDRGRLPAAVLAAYTAAH